MAARMLRPSVLVTARGPCVRRADVRTESDSALCPSAAEAIVRYNAAKMSRRPIVQVSQTAAKPTRPCREDNTVPTYRLSASIGLEYKRRAETTLRPERRATHRCHLDA